MLDFIDPLENSEPKSFKGFRKRKKKKEGRIQYETNTFRMELTQEKMSHQNRSFEGKGER